MPFQSDSVGSNEGSAYQTEYRYKARKGNADESGSDESEKRVCKKQDVPCKDDQRRNLYVLGIPHHMTLEDLKDLFGRFGGVQHAVILAVLDAFRRRRGFIVMNSNAEAAVAMKGMSGTVVNGHKFHVSWAVVQRSNGFLDGVDRTSSAAPPSGLPSSQWSPHPPQGFRYDRSRPVKVPPALTLSTSSKRHAEFSITSHSSTIILGNLHCEIFKSASDVLPLLEPFGAVQRIRLITPPAHSKRSELKDDPTPTHKAKPLPPADAAPVEVQDNLGDAAKHTIAAQNSESTHIGAMVEFSNDLEASAAIAALDGQVYGSIAIKAERAQTKDSERHDTAVDPDSESADYEDIDSVSRSRFLTKKRPYNTPSLPGSPYYGTFGSPFVGSPGIFGYHPGFPMNGSPWMSPYSNSAPPSPAQLASFYYAQENSPDPYHPSNRFPYGYAKDFRYPETRPFMSRTYSQQH